MEGCINSGAGVYCSYFTFFSPVGRFRPASDGDIEAKQIALSKLLCYLEHFSRVVLCRQLTFLEPHIRWLLGIASPSCSRYLTKIKLFNISGSKLPTGKREMKKKKKRHTDYSNC
ncbi:hypothetical protein TNCT_530551 [Trichonephila clavata]|uniref:Uncharacterized protein n=1 Tax=Trichonephila clavata TaxID=2740835 RepID=A0A8X6JEL2_TRICU|nr:hypothetical protein TNCT_530551 [Trichonephila clavata]